MKLQKLSRLDLVEVFFWASIRVAGARFYGEILQHPL